MFDVAHALSFLDAELFALLVPAPLVDLVDVQRGQARDLLDLLLAPVRVLVEVAAQRAQLIAGLALPFPNNALEGACLGVEIVSAAR